MSEIVSSSWLESIGFSKQGYQYLGWHQDGHYALSVDLREHLSGIGIHYGYRDSDQPCSSGSTDSLPCEPTPDNILLALKLFNINL